MNTIKNKIEEIKKLKDGDIVSDGFGSYAEIRKSVLENNISYLDLKAVGIKKDVSANDFIERFYTTSCKIYREIESEESKAKQKISDFLGNLSDREFNEYAINLIYKKYFKYSDSDGASDFYGDVITFVLDAACTFWSMGGWCRCSMMNTRIGGTTFPCA